MTDPRPEWGYISPRLRAKVAAIEVFRCLMRVSNILFVHGAWANSSTWNKVLPQLAGLGTGLTAVQLPLTSLAGDARTLRQALALVEGPTLLVGHSYGGAVITEAGCDDKVVGLLYVAGFAPDAGESAASLGAGGPPTKLPGELKADATGFLKPRAGWRRPSHRMCPARNSNSSS